jgi:hypothetical protein
MPLIQHGPNLLVHMRCNGGGVADVRASLAVQAFFAKLDAFDHLVFTAGDSLRVQDLAATDLKTPKE